MAPVPTTLGASEILSVSSLPAGTSGCELDGAALTSREAPVAGELDVVTRLDRFDRVPVGDCVAFPFRLPLIRFCNSL